MSFKIEKSDAYYSRLLLRLRRWQAWRQYKHCEALEKEQRFLEKIKNGGNNV